MKKLTRDDVIAKLDSGDKDFSRCDLSGLDLSSLDFSWALMRRADFSGADLRGANLSMADLIRADLRGADLRGANLSYAVLTNTKMDYRLEPGLIQKIARNVLAVPSSLDMAEWHSDCGTVHCIAGMACNLAKNGHHLEKKFGTQVAALMLLGPEPHSHFFDDNDDALIYLQSVLDRRYEH